MTADMTQDRRVTVPNRGANHTVLVDGSRLFWASLSSVHERLGYRVLAPDRIQGDAMFSHASFTAQSRIMSRRSFRDQSSRPSSVAPCSPPSRRGLARLEFAAPAQRRPALTAAARGAPAGSRSGRRNGLGRTKKLGFQGRGVRCNACPLIPQPWLLLEESAAPPAS
jgi:hypothetical protein